MLASTLFKFCLDVMKIQTGRGKGFIVITPAWLSIERISKCQNQDKDWLHLLDITSYCSAILLSNPLACNYYKKDDDDQFETKASLDTNGKRWRDPQWKTLPPRLFGLLRVSLNLFHAKT